jgi:hypothetical protein
MQLPLMQEEEVGNCGGTERHSTRSEESLKELWITA